MLEQRDNTWDEYIPSLPMPGGEKREYQAFGWGAPGRVEPPTQLAFEVRKTKGAYWEGKAIHYAHLRPFDFVSDQWLLLPTAEFFITLRGEGLHKMVTPLRRQYVEYIQLYHPDFFHEPKPGMPIITEIRIDVRN